MTVRALWGQVFERLWSSTFAKVAVALVTPDIVPTTTKPSIEFTAIFSVLPVVRLSPLPVSKVCVSTLPYPSIASVFVQTDPEILIARGIPNELMVLLARDGD